MCNVVKGKWFGFFCILAILALASLANAAASFQSVTLLKAAPPNDDTALAFNDYGDACERDPNVYPLGGGGSANMHIRWIEVNDTGRILKTEQAQSFRPLTADGNIGGVAFQLRLTDPNSDANSTDPNIKPPKAMVKTANEVFVVSLYAMRNFKDPLLQDDKFLMRWSGKIPAGLDTDPCDSNTAQLGDWLKFTFDKGYHLLKDKTYAVRFGWQSIEKSVIDTNNVRRMWIESSTIKQLDPCDSNTRDGGTYVVPGTYSRSSPGRKVVYNWDSSLGDELQTSVWLNTGNDIDFAILKATTQPVCYGCPTGDVTKDCEVKLDDFVTLASNWTSNVSFPLAPDPCARTAIEHFYSNTDDPMFASESPPGNIIVLNNALPEVDAPTKFDEIYAPPIVGWPSCVPWTRTLTPIENPDANDANIGNIPENQWAQSFLAPRTVGMDAIAIQIASGITGPISQTTDQQGFIINIYEVNDINSPPADPNLYPNYPTTLLASFPAGKWHAKSPAYYTESFIGRPGNWITFVLPQTVQLTAGHCYAFALEWALGNSSGPGGRDTRNFRVDASEPNSLDPEYDGPEGTYANGKCWKRTYSHYDEGSGITTPGPYTDYKYDVNGVLLDPNIYANTVDVEFAIIGPLTWCQAQEHSKSLGYNSPDWGVGYIFNRVTPGDLNHDCKVNMKDMYILAVTWLEKNIL